MTTREDLKSEAKRLKEAASKMFGVPVSTAQSLELVAKAKNFPSWDAAVACAHGTGGKLESSKTLSRNAQIGQLIAFRSGLVNGLALASAVRILTEQPNEAATAGWKRVQLDGETTMSRVLMETLLFDDDLFPIARMGDAYGDWGQVCSDLIAYLQMVERRAA